MEDVDPLSDVTTVGQPPADGGSSAEGATTKTDPGTNALPKDEAAEMESKGASCSEDDPRMQPLDELFSEGNLLRDVMGAECRVPGLEDAVARFRETGCLIIAGLEKQNCCWAGTEIARQVGFSYIYASDSVRTAGLETAEIVNSLLRQDRAPTCVILSCMAFHDNRGFPAAIQRFSDSAKRLVRSKRGLIVYVTPFAVSRIDENERGGWPETVVLLEVPDSRPAGPASTSSAKPPEQFYEELFLPPLETDEQLAGADRRYFIPRVLVRLAVLFPEISTGNFDRLAAAAFRNREVEVSPATEKTLAKSRSAWDLWSEDRARYERAAGLRRTPVGAAYTISFVSAAMKETAQEWVWQYPEDLFAVISPILQQPILFGDYDEDEEEALFRAFMSATVELAHRAPGLFGARWLEAILQDFAGWVREQTPELEGSATDLFTFLRQLEGQAKRRSYWGRFAERTAMLAGLLNKDHSEQVVDSFLNRLVRQGFGELVLQILRRMGDGQPAQKRFALLEQIIRSPDADDRVAVLRELALLTLWDPETTVPILLPRLDAWLEDAGPGESSPLQDVALAFPAFLFRRADELPLNPEQNSSPLLAALEVSSSERTLGNFCARAIVHERFVACVANYFLSDQTRTEDRTAFALALPLYRSALALPDARQAIVHRLRDTSFTVRPMSVRQQVRSLWQRFADQCLQAMGEITDRYSLEGKRRRQALERRYRVIEALIRQ